MKKTILVSLMASLTMSVVLSVSLAHAADKSDCASESHYPLVTKAELKTIAEKKSAFIVDVNSEESYQKVHVPGAIHFGSHEKDFTTLLPKDKNALIVSYCGGVTCGAWKKAAEEACKQGYTNIRHFKEGIQGWTSASN